MIVSFRSQNDIKNLLFLKNPFLGWEEGSRGREHMYTCDLFMLMNGRNQHDVVIILQLKINYKNPFLLVSIGKTFSLVSSIFFVFVFTKINLVHVCACTYPSLSPFFKWKSLSCVRLFATPCTIQVHGILQARILEWVAFPFSRASSQPRDQTQVLHIAGGFFTIWATREAPFL